MDPKDKAQKFGKDALRHLHLNQRVAQDMMLDATNPKQLLPLAYQHVNDTANLLTDLSALRTAGDLDEVPQKRVRMVIAGTNNYLREEDKYQSVYDAEAYSTSDDFKEKSWTGLTEEAISAYKEAESLKISRAIDANILFG